MLIIKYRNLFYFLSAVLVLASGWLWWQFGLNPGVDFQGGTVMELSYPETRPLSSEINQRLSTLGDKGFSVQLVGDKRVILKARTLSNQESETVVRLLSFSPSNQPVLELANTIGPALGKELARKGVFAIVLVVLVIVAYIAFVFRKVSEPVASWKYGLVAIIALIHDIIIACGFFILLGWWRGAEANALFLTALLTILGLSINDTIVVFDRLRENLKNKISNDFATVAGISIRETLVRSINTTLTTILALAMIAYLGPSTTQNFALVLMVGMTVGTYSSICLATPLLVTWDKISRSGKKL